MEDIDEVGCLDGEHGLGGKRDSGLWKCSRLIIGTGAHGALPSEAGRPNVFETLELSPRDSEELGRLGVDQRTRSQVVEDNDSALLSRVQSDPAIHGVRDSLFASGVTDSLFASGVTDSLYSHRLDAAIDALPRTC